MRDKEVQGGSQDVLRGSKDLVSKDLLTPSPHARRLREREREREEIDGGGREREREKESEREFDGEGTRAAVSGAVGHGSRKPQPLGSVAWDRRTRPGLPVCE
jgi:hypothetical protein